MGYMVHTVLFGHHTLQMPMCQVNVIRINMYQCIFPLPNSRKCTATLYRRLHPILIKHMKIPMVHR